MRSTAVVGLVGLYARTVLAMDRRAALFASGLGGLYGLLYVILQAEAFALLAGSWTLFLALAALMYFTRRVNWGEVGPKAGALANPATSE